MDGSTCRSVFRTDEVMTDGSSDVRPSTEKSRDRSLKTRKRSGSAVGLSGKPRYFRSCTTPIIVSHGRGELRPPTLIRLPMGFRPGQKRLTRLSVTIATLAL